MTIILSYHLKRRKTIRFIKIEGVKYMQLMADVAGAFKLAVEDHKPFY